MRRVIVAGGSGFFGQAVLKCLADDGAAAIAASRRARQGLSLDVENPDSLTHRLRAGDIVIDTVGPFQTRTTALLEAATRIGCDVVDISDSLSYAQHADQMHDRMVAAGIHVFPSCSSVSVFTSLLVALSEIAAPTKARGFLIPSARYSASAATANSLLRSVGPSIQVWREGRLQETAGWSSSKAVQFPQPIGTVRGHLLESADSYWLPLGWPSLKTVELAVDTRVPGLNGVMSLAARQPRVRQFIERFQTLGHGLARRLGRRDGCLAVEVQAASGEVVRRAIYCPDHGYRLAVLPAVLAARALLEDRVSSPGIVRPPRQLGADELRHAIKRAGFVLQ